MIALSKELDRISISLFKIAFLKLKKKKIKFQTEIRNTHKINLHENE